jgi:hypothetical protein
MELKTQDPLFDDVGMSFGRPEIMPPINKSFQGLQFQDYCDKLVVNYQWRLKSTRTHTFSK